MKFLESIVSIIILIIFFVFILGFLGIAIITMPIWFTVLFIMAWKDKKKSVKEDPTTSESVNLIDNPFNSNKLPN